MESSSSSTMSPLDLSIPADLLAPLPTFDDFYNDYEGGSIYNELESSGEAPPLSDMFTCPEYVFDPHNNIFSLPTSHSSVEEVQEDEEENFVFVAEEFGEKLFGGDETPISLPPPVSARSVVAKKRKRDDSGKFTSVKPVSAMGEDVCHRMIPVLSSEDIDFQEKLSAVVANSLLHSKDVVVNPAIPAPTKPHQGTFS